jgi:hypothetical protein
MVGDGMGVSETGAVVLGVDEGILLETSSSWTVSFFFVLMNK